MFGFAGVEVAGHGLTFVELVVPVGPDDEARMWDDLAHVAVVELLFFDDRELLLTSLEFDPIVDGLRILKQPERI
jgi:hypothetical protein